MLGLPDEDMVTALIDAFAGGDVAGALERSAELLQRGIAQDQLIEVLIERLRQLMLIIACGHDSELVELSDESRATATTQSEKFDAPGIVYMIALCDSLQRSCKMSANPRALFDATMVRLALAENMGDVTALLTSGKTSSPSTGRNLIPNTEPKSISPHTKKKEVAVLQNDTDSTVAPDATQTWTRLLESIGNKPAMAWAQHLTPMRIDATTIHVTAQPGHRDVIGFVNAHRCQQLADLLKPILGRPIKVALDTTNAQTNQDLASPAKPVSGQPDSAARPSTKQADRDQVMQLPLVKQVLEVFDATVVSARQNR